MNRIQRGLIISAICFFCLLPFPAKPQNTASGNKKDWIKQSDHYTQMLIDLDKKYSPEFGSNEGLPEYDTLVAAPTLANQLAKRKEEEQLVSVFTAALEKEKQEPVLQDLHILIHHMDLGFRQQDYQLTHRVPFLNATTTIYEGLRILLDAQTATERRHAVIVRMRKYAGLEPGYQSITTIFEDRVKHQIAAQNMVYPSRQKMELDLSRDASIMGGVAELCKKYNLKNWEEPYGILKKQVEDYDQWTREQVLPKAREDFRMPPEEYALAFENFGIDISPAEIARMAHAAFTNIQNEMKPIAAEIASRRHLASGDYRSVMHELKKEQIHGDSIIPLYERHLKDIEAIIRQHQLVTLPNRPAIIRLATVAETAQQPAPHMDPPPFLNNTGQRGVFVLPLNMPSPPGGKTEDKYDDFTFDAASWTIIAHEARPGHELQFDKMVEEGVSRARVLYAFNSTNVEGWGLYAEYMIRPYMPLEGRLVSLDYLLLRAARAFLDPELQAGTITQDQAFQVLTKDVVSSKAFADEEVQRFTLKNPGQANSYFYGFTKMIALKKETEQALGSKFSDLHFHDFILSQGLLPPDLIRQAVEQEFIPAERNK